MALLDRDGGGVATAAEALPRRGEGDWVPRPTWRIVLHSKRVFAVREQLGLMRSPVSSAGIESFDAVLDITPEKWDHILAVNLTGTFTCMQLAVQDMTTAQWGPR